MKILWHTMEQKLVKYPRDDDAEVVGLDAVYEVYDLINEDKPSFDAETQYLSPSQAIDHGSKTVTRGWSIETIETPPIVVSMVALRLTLIEADLEPQILAAIAGIPDAKQKAAATAWWQTAQTVRRMHPLVIQLATAIGKTDAEIDAIFASAKQLEVTL